MLTSTKWVFLRFTAALRLRLIFFLNCLFALIVEWRANAAAEIRDRNTVIIIGVFKQEGGRTKGEYKCTSEISLFGVLTRWWGVWSPAWRWSAGSPSPARPAAAPGTWRTGTPTRPRGRRAGGADAEPSPRVWLGAGREAGGGGCPQ